MFLIRDVFHSKPGKAKELVKVFKNMANELEGSGVKSTKILTDASSSYWTVIIESEVEDINSYLNMAHSVSASTNKEEQKSETTDYRDLVTGGYREIFRVE